MTNWTLKTRVSARGQPRCAPEQPAAKIVDEPGNRAGRDERRNQERGLDGAREPVAGGQQPEIERRLVGIEIAADAREQPVAACDHVARDEREARLIRGPRHAHAEARADHQRDGERKPEKIGKPRGSLSAAPVEAPRRDAVAAASLPSSRELRGPSVIGWSVAGEPTGFEIHHQVVDGHRRRETDSRARPPNRSCPR